MSSENDSEESIFKSKFYFKLNEAVQDVKTEFQLGDVKDKAMASAKLFGKTAFNLGLFAGKVGVEVVKKLPEIAEISLKNNAQIAEEHLKNNKNLTDEQRDKLESIAARSKK